MLHLQRNAVSVDPGKYSPAPETEREGKGSGELEANEDGKEKGSEEVQAGKEDGKGIIL